MFVKEVLAKNSKAKRPPLKMHMDAILICSIYSVVGERFADVVIRILHHLKIVAFSQLVGDPELGRVI